MTAAPKLDALPTNLGRLAHMTGIDCCNGNALHRMCSRSTGKALFWTRVVKHKGDGYRGVIYGWDRVCRYPQYVMDADVNFVQPFYSIIPDENDAIRSFGGPRMMQYVAQEHIISITEPFKISNRALLFHFDAYSPKTGRYIPKAQLQYEYPGAYAEQELQPCNETEIEQAPVVITVNRPPRRKRPIMKSGNRSDRSQPTRSPSTPPTKVRPRVKGSDKAT